LAGTVEILRNSRSTPIYVPGELGSRLKTENTKLLVKSFYSRPFYALRALHICIVRQSYSYQDIYIGRSE